MSRMDVNSLGETVQEVVLSGRLDAPGVAALEAPFTAALSGASKDAIVDLTRVDFCGSLGIRMFLGAARVLQRRDRRMVLAGAQPQVQEVFETLALGSVVLLAATPEEARNLLAA